MNIITKLALVMSSIFLISCQSPSLQSAGKGINSSPAMWLATKGEHKTYLLGSVHILPSQVKWYSPRIQQAFDTSSQVAFEVLDTETSKDEYKNYLKQYGLLPHNKTISDYLTEKEYAKYEMISAQLGLDGDYADRMKPWLFFIALNSIASRDYSKYGVDNLLENEARSQGKKLYNLETVSQALNAISSVSMSKDVKDLKKFLNKTAVSKNEEHRRISLLEAWATGDTNTAKRLLAKSIRGKEYYNMIVKRNNDWYPKILQIMSSNEQSMIIVGLAHFVGQGNLIDKLRRSGFIVTRVR